MTSDARNGMGEAGCGAPRRHMVTRQRARLAESPAPYQLNGLEDEIEL